MPDIQTSEAVERARERLQDAAERKSGTTERAPVTEAERLPAKSKSDIIRPTDKKPKKKTFGARFKEAFFGENATPGSIAENIFFRIFIPKLKMVLSEMANSAINSALGMDSRTRTFGGNGYNVHQSNASIYRDRGYNRGGSVNGIRRGAISDEVWDEDTANDIYRQMMDILDQFPEEGLTVADVWSIMGFPERIRSTDREWGWTSKRGIDLVEIDPVKHLYIIDVCAPRAL